MPALAAGRPPERGNDYLGCDDSADVGLHHQLDAKRARALRQTDRSAVRLLGEADAEVGGRVRRPAAGDCHDHVVAVEERGAGGHRREALVVLLLGLVFWVELTEGSCPAAELVPLVEAIGLVLGPKGQDETQLLLAEANRVSVRSSKRIREFRGRRRRSACSSSWRRRSAWRVHNGGPGERVRAFKQTLVHSCSPALCQRRQNLANAVAGHEVAKARDRTPDCSLQQVLSKESLTYHRGVFRKTPQRSGWPIVVCQSCQAWGGKWCITHDRL
jgi:hypothetical protein